MAIRQTGIVQTEAQGSHIDEIRTKAEMGDAKAQYHLGLMCYGGRFVVQDYVEAYKWFTLAVERGEEGSKAYREVVRNLLTPEQIAEGKKRVDDFVPVVEKA